MTRAVVEETRAVLETELIKTIGIISELLVVNFEEHALDVIEYGQVNSSESLTSYTAYSFIHTQLIVGSEMGTLLRLKEPDMVMNTYRNLHNSKKAETLDRKMYKAAKYLAETVATLLGDVMEQLTVVLFDFHQQKD